MSFSLAWLGMVGTGLFDLCSDPFLDHRSGRGEDCSNGCLPSVRLSGKVGNQVECTCWEVRVDDLVASV